MRELDETLARIDRHLASLDAGQKRLRWMLGVLMYSLFLIGVFTFLERAK